MRSNGLAILLLLFELVWSVSIRSCDQFSGRSVACLSWPNCYRSSKTTETWIHQRAYTKHLFGFIWHAVMDHLRSNAKTRHYPISNYLDECPEKKYFKQMPVGTLCNNRRTFLIIRSCLSGYFLSYVSPSLAYRIGLPFVMSKRDKSSHCSAV